MRIVDLDGHGLNPGDLSWTGFEQLGDFKTYDLTEEDDQLILERIGDAEIVLTNKTPLDRQVITNAPNIKYIGVQATGYNVVDTAAAKEKGIIVTNVPSYSTHEVAQHTLALLLEITNLVGMHATAVSQGEWTDTDSFTFWKKPLISLTGKIFGMIGFGNIAQATAKLAHAFGMEVVFYNHRPKEFSEPWLKQVSLEELYAQADIISLHVPQTAETTKMINKAAIDKMKSGVILLNTARGGLLDEQAVADGLNVGKIYALGADVVSEEPIKADNPLLAAKNAYLTPHIAWAPTAARQRCMDIAVNNLQSFLNGQPKNVVG
ncbi:D-2-hydroxyacid dehydrogenase [Liquorilactobacillus vini]|uniref:Glycerate dehydrogenase n=1 Tax=Liquorilactobacillus vini DSM 20605 TaxID=1133569 RepID=A0A0R2BVX4_9LACO|nr:D-2-hydroxyacid dehydrogenase [Liquorilactobacillus vini]KRM83438.1 glycerate dehydrogenase [Liquorilactobacillus vini DSM 20605]